MGHPVTHFQHAIRSEDVVLVEDECVVRPEVVVEVARPPLLVAQVFAVVRQPRLVDVRLRSVK